MMRLFLNGLAASASGGLTYLRNVLPRLASRTDVETTVALSPALREEFGNQPSITFLELDPPSGTAHRFWYEQVSLPRLIRRSRADVLISTGNFALRRSPVPQILLSRNSLYTSADFYRDLHQRREFAMWLDTCIKAAFAKRSINWADRTVAPSAAFADELRRWTGREVAAIHHSFDGDAFFRDQTPLSAEVCEKFNRAQDSLRLLFVSHYNYYRNFETLLRALPLLREQIHDCKPKLFLTCRLKPGENPGSYRAESAASLVAQLGIAENVVELGAVPYRLLHQIYRSCHLYVTPAYAESFAHPLVEAMACGLPVVASDLPVHREICGDAALYFHRFSPEELATAISRVASSPDLAKSLSISGLQRCQAFSWEQHVDRLISLASSLTACRRT